MKTIVKTLLIVMITASATNCMAQKDKQEIQKVIEKGYIQGLHNQGDLNETAKSFHPGFNLLILKNNLLDKFPIYTWIEVSEKRRESPKSKERPEVTAKYPMIEITDNAAVAKVELYQNEEKIFTDYLSLYKFEEGWRIVSKIYADHRK